MQKLARAAVAELLGTFALCFIGAGAVCTNQWTGGAVGLGPVLAVMISALGHISGGHFNPAVTAGLLTANKIDSARASVYVLAQLAGAVIAGWLLTLVLPADAWRAAEVGAPSLAAGITPVQGFLIEAVLTFFLVLAVFGTAVAPQGR